MVVGSDLCRDRARLYRYLSEGLGSIPAIGQIECSITYRDVKFAGMHAAAVR